MKFINKFFKIHDNKSTICGFNCELKALYMNFFGDNKKKDIVYVSNSLYEANKIYQSLINYNSNVLLFPMDDFLTSEALAISPELKITRLETLKKLVSCDNNFIVVTNLMGYLRYLPNANLYNESVIKITKGADYQITNLVNNLVSIGYENQTIVSKTGEFASRGFVVDIFPISSENPIRIEFWGDTVDSIREFDVDTQLTIKNIDDVVIYPNSEFLISSFTTLEEHKHKDLINYCDVVSILGYLKNPTIFFDNYNQIEVGYNQLQKEMFDYSVANEILPSTKYMFDLDDIVFNDAYYFSNFDDVVDNSTFSKYDTCEVESFLGNIENLKLGINHFISQGNTVVLCVNNRYKANKLIEELGIKIIFTNEEQIFNGKINLIIKKIQKGFKLNDFVILSESEIFDKKEVSYSYKTNFKFGTKIRDINKLSFGDYVVHSIHGIGRYVGIKTLDKNGLKKDYLQIEYKDSDKLYIPVEKIELLSKYSLADGSVPRLNKLGGTEWAKTKLKVRSKIKDMTAELLQLYAERENAKGYSFIKDDEDQINFEKEFPYVPTPDQIRVTDEIKKEMESSKPMDRLLCGDVGYGKTEVAFRAAFKAILSGKQVALLCPTTILSNQHYKSAIDRFSSFPVNIALLNRFVPSSRANEILNDVSTGKIDFLIGTHRILSDDVKFKDLGFLIIDEEQRFGVRHKEKIKQYKNNVDVLTLSATPIPRTLQMAMSGVRSLSLLETPPVDRYPVQTYVIGENKQIIKDAIYKEMSRNGQIFILFNNIEQMNSKKEEISSLVPDARIVAAHGRMEKNTLENIMIDFIDKKYDILLCTTIIETGIDIPNVNTLIIYDADHFGLSQLYQIRGRVGRSNKIAYCYLLYDKRKILSEVATKRLNVIKDFTELGSGFSIAMRDLSIRGAGDILGSEQAGFVDSVGIDLFLKMLDEEVSRARGIDKVVDDLERSTPLIEVATNISDDYVKDEDLKIFIHQKINTITSKDDLDSVRRELNDRFGKISDNIEIYMQEELFENMSKKLHIIDVKQTKNFIEIILPEEICNKLQYDKLFVAVSKISMMFRFSLKKNRLCITLDIVKLDKHFIYYLVSLLDVLNLELNQK